MADLKPDVAYEMNVGVGPDGRLRIFALVPRESPWPSDHATARQLIDITDRLAQQFSEP